MLGAAIRFDDVINLGNLIVASIGVGITGLLGYSGHRHQVHHNQTMVVAKQTRDATREMAAIAVELGWHESDGHGPRPETHPYRVD